MPGIIGDAGIEHALTHLLSVHADFIIADAGNIHPGAHRGIPQIFDVARKGRVTGEVRGLRQPPGGKAVQKRRFKRLLPALQPHAVRRHCDAVAILRARFQGRSAVFDAAGIVGQDLPGVPCGVLALPYIDPIALLTGSIFQFPGKDGICPHADGVYPVIARYFDQFRHNFSNLVFTLLIIP